MSTPRVPRILLVDDEPLVGVVMARALLKAGYDVVVQLDGPAAWECADGQEFDLLVVDTEMPRMRGPELVELIRAQCPTIPVLHISGSIDPRKGRSEYPADVPALGKPFHMSLFLFMVTDLLSQHTLPASEHPPAGT